MSRNKVLAILTAVSVSACLYACGSDDDSNPSGGAGMAGHAGSKGGSGGSAGKAGGSGTAGKPATGGSGNQAGESFGGEGGEGEVGGAGGDSGGGMAGDSGLGGAGGEGGAPAALTLAEACTATCTPAHSVGTCSTEQDACVTTCTSYPELVSVFVTDEAQAKTLNDEYLAMMSCTAAHLPNTAQYACSQAGAINPWSPVADTTCEAALCKWTCDDVTFGTFSGDGAVGTRCGCG